MCHWSFCPILDVDFPVIGFQPGWVSVFLVDWFYLSLSRHIEWISLTKLLEWLQIASILIMPARVLTGWIYFIYCFIWLVWFTFSIACIWLIEIYLSDWDIDAYDSLIIIWLRLYCFALVICFCFFISCSLCCRRFNDIYMHILLTIYSWKVLNLAGSTQALNFNITHHQWSHHHHPSILKDRKCTMHERVIKPNVWYKTCENYGVQWNAVVGSGNNVMPHVPVKMWDNMPYAFNIGCMWSSKCIFGAFDDCYYDLYAIAKKDRKCY